MTAPCDNCGAAEDDRGLAAVHRVYLVTDDQGRVTGERILEEIEQWCLSCRSLYPHRRIPHDRPSESQDDRRLFDR